MNADRRKIITSVFVRACKDSGFQLDSIRAATLTAGATGCSPFNVWTAVGSLDAMNEIAAGTHPAARASL